jgi:hypothetical protein
MAAQYCKLKHASRKSPYHINHAAEGVIADTSTPYKYLDRLKQQTEQVKRIYKKLLKKHYFTLHDRLHKYI